METAYCRVSGFDGYLDAPVAPKSATRGAVLSAGRDHRHEEGTVGFGDMVDKAKDLVGSNKESVKDGIDKAADAADKATGGKATDQIETGAEKAKDVVDDQT